ncbi:MAG TPA: cyclically-permuted mutarotase family protein [Candidatus Bacteroides avicola]|uniref:Cyclically-permuted mutarotase family protein n=1 Tax=Candidatus Bacteroides avicola TaxID=2838468 RepID=A0A9D2KWC7_9BACE|nr:cyclically-permuted mutarotase family protein [Candidatus Bacteroides avicola]
MNRLLVFIQFCILSLHIGLSAQETDPYTLPDFPIRKGVSAPFAGLADGRLIVAGGCNFPDTPAAEGGRKAFYDAIYAIELTHDSATWSLLSTLPEPIAYGATVTTSKGIVCIGGQNEQGPQTSVWQLDADGHLTHLPSLPAPVDNGGAALIGHTVYVTGGNQPDGKKALYALNLNNPTAWKRLADYPGLQRIQPIVLSSDNRLFLIGGYSFDAASKTCIPSTDMLSYDPSTDTWSNLDAIVPEKDGTLRCLAGGSGICKEGRLYLTGGVNLTIFRQAMEGKAPADYMRKSPDWYRFNDDLLIYDLQAGNWSIYPDMPGLARAGGILLEYQDRLYMICGEIKPGIRTPQITVIPRKGWKNP